jgi:FixJ family two-component response regulator
LSQLEIISIVDDDESVREAMEELVSLLGYGALTFASAEEFLESGTVTRTSCLILDMQMPGLSGLELQSRLISQGHKTPTIFITALPCERIRDCALAAGAIGLLRKPFRERDLVQLISAALRTSDRNL